MKTNQHLSLVAILLSFSFLVKAQEIDYVDYKWEDKPSFEAPEVDGEHSEIVIKDKKVLEFIIEENGFYQYDLRHEVIYIASEAGVEDNNKVYLTTSGSQEVVYQKARVINSKGEIIEFNESDIQEGENEESGYTFKYFALDGLDIGSFVELQFLVKKLSMHRGIRKIFQSSILKRNIDFEFICPENLVFGFKSLNGFPEVSLDTTMNEKNYWSVKIDEMPKFESEPMAYSSSNLKGLIYKLNENTYTGASDMNSYGEVAKNYYDYVYEATTKSEKKQVKKFLKKIGIKKEMKAEEKIRMLENHLKANFAVLPYVQPEYEAIDALLANKASSEDAFIRLYAIAFDEMEIKTQVVLTSDRSSIRFDKDFEGYNFLQATVFFITELNMYLDPSAENLRLGFIPHEYMNNYGLFVKPLKIGDITTGLGKIKFIKPLSNKLTANNHFVKVDMTEDPFEPNFSFELQMSGYYSRFLQTSYSLLSDDERERVDESLVEMVTTEKTDAELTVENGDAESFGKKPLTLKASLSSLSFTEKAGNKVIFKVGELIGPQAELYNEKPRVLAIENDFNRTYYREIEVTLPEGYDVSNLDKLNFDVSMSDNSAVFKSSYTIEGNLLKVMVDEYYTRIGYSLEEYPDYEKVINAAADFNKVVIYLEEKS